ncbi:MAG: hypothetical protein HQ510_04400 [Candidatus Marinimicrobia bacterium]|nr:hypothetical protein [Candidatus Neomarinimicrobiota bacterium]
MTEIRKFLQEVRSNQTKIGMVNALLYGLTISIPLIFLLIFLESVFYLSTDSRLKIITLLMVLTGVCVTFVLIKYFIHRNGWFGNSSDESMANWVGQKDNQIQDKLLNAHQLEKNMMESGEKNDLIQAAVNRIMVIIRQNPIDIYKINISKNLKRWTSGILFVSLLLIAVFYQSSLPAVDRWVHPNVEYPVPLPFALVSLTGDQSILGGDSLTITITGVGELPDSISLIWKSRNQSQQATVGKMNDVFSYQFMDIKSDMEYFAFSKSSHWFSSWSEIASDTYQISVKDRPVVEDVKFTIIPPEYTLDEPWLHPGNITDITALSGSHLAIEAQSTKPLTMAWVLLENDRKNLSVHGDKISGTLTVSQDETIEIYCLDQNDVANINPTRYRMRAIPDFPPDLLIPRPDKEIKLDEWMQIDFSIQTSDDYGFSAAWIEYTITHPEYILPDTNLYTHGIPELEENIRSQQIYHSWDVSYLGLAPEDEIQFHVIVSDNNLLTGPSQTKSSQFIARYPSLEDMFLDLESTEFQTEENVEDIFLSMDDVKELMEELELELLKSDEVDWEQTKKTEKMLEKMEDITQQIEQLQENMDKINEQIEQNNLVDEPLKEKFSKLQELLDEIMTPELLEAMAKLQEAMETMDPEKMLEALENFEMNMAELEEQLDRFIDMFQQALAEQQLDEVVKQLEKMVQEQTKIVEEMAQDPDESKMNELASKERRQEERFKGVKDQMDDASEAMKDFASEPAEDMKKLLDSDLSKNTEESISSARQSLQNNEMSNSQEQTEQSQENLETMLSKAQQIQDDYQQQTVQEMMVEFQQVLQNTLAISQRQEQLRKSSTGLRSNSPRLAETAYEQDKVRRQTNQLFNQLTELSKKTFYISPKIGRALGSARVSMDKSIAKLEQKQISHALKDQKASMEGLNEAAKLLLGAMNQMQSSGSASGFESFLEQMGEMSKQQQGINQGTMQLGQMALSAQQQMMQKLQAQQQQVQQSLQELMQSMPEQGSDGLGKAADDMEEVVKDFKRRQVNRRTMERQERILSRMLDTQKSLTKRDYSEKRKSNTGEALLYSGPAGLPSDLGQREILLIKAMENALNEGHSREYQSMMKTYFRNLQKESEASEKSGTDND